MSTLYSDTLEQINRLTPIDQLRLLEELAALVRRQMSAPPRRDIMELKGLGKEIWKGIDAQEYIEQERDSWNG